jgi:hypothetical protein
VLDGSFQIDGERTKGARHGVVRGATEREGGGPAVQHVEEALAARTGLELTEAGDAWLVCHTSDVGVTPRVSNPHDYVDHVFKRPKELVGTQNLDLIQSFQVLISMD